MMGGDRGKENGARRCKGVTGVGTACRRRATHDDFCQRHAGATAFYARGLTPVERQSYKDALAQEGLAGEVALLRLHLLRLVERDERDKVAEIPRAVHALVRALRDSQAAGANGIAALDALIRAEGGRLLAASEADQPEANQEADQPEANQEADQPEANQEADQPEANQEADQPEANQEANQPEANQEANQPEADQPEQE